jgi:pyridoxamine 5'-phosphate oxidase
VVGRSGVVASGEVRSPACHLAATGGAGRDRDCRDGQDGPVSRDPPDLPDLANLRSDYRTSGLSEADLAADWLSQFHAWLADAIAAGVSEPNAMTLATADRSGRPSARTVLLKQYDRRGFVFFTNLGSRKATEALSNPYAALVFAWLARHRQVVVCGTVAELPRADTEAYFAHRPRGAQLGAWASSQSRVLASRAELERGYAEVAGRFPGRVPAPPDWGGLRVVPESVEFWQGSADRLHDRLRYRRAGAGWLVERLAP